MIWMSVNVMFIHDHEENCIGVGMPGSIVE